MHGLDWLQAHRLWQSTVTYRELSVKSGVLQQSLLTLCHVCWCSYISARRNESLELNKHEPMKIRITWWCFTSGTHFHQERWSPHSSRNLQSSKSLPPSHRITFSSTGDTFRDTFPWSCRWEHPSHRKRISSPVWSGLVSSAASPLREETWKHPCVFF